MCSEPFPTDKTCAQHLPDITASLKPFVPLKNAQILPMWLLPEEEARSQRRGSPRSGSLGAASFETRFPVISGQGQGGRVGTVPAAATFQGKEGPNPSGWKTGSDIEISVGGILLCWSAKRITHGKHKSVSQRGHWGGGGRGTPTPVCRGGGNGNIKHPLSSLTAGRAAVYPHFTDEDVATLRPAAAPSLGSRCAGP